MREIPFTKMHGLGNDFVVIDGRELSFGLNSRLISMIADRHYGIGCDQLVQLELPAHKEADVFMRIFNADGSESEACGNATRCVAASIMAEKEKKMAAIETIAGVLYVVREGPGLISVDMGKVRLNWDEIPLVRKMDTLNLKIKVKPLAGPTAVNIGNPHAVFFVPDLDKVLLEDCGRKVETHPFYPQRTNVEVVQVLSRNRIRVKVWERGVGITKASGSCAAAALVAAHRRGLTNRKAKVVLDGGSLIVEWKSNGHVIQTGPHAEVFSGNLCLKNFQGIR